MVPTGSAGASKGASVVAAGNARLLMLSSGYKSEKEHDQHQTPLNCEEAYCVEARLHFQPMFCHGLCH